VKADRRYQEPALQYRVVILNYCNGENELPTVIGRCKCRDDAESLASSQLADWNVAAVEQWGPRTGEWHCVSLDYYADIQPYMDGMIARFPESVRQYYTSQQQRMVETEGTE